MNPLLMLIYVPCDITHLLEVHIKKWLSNSTLFNQRKTGPVFNRTNDRRSSTMSCFNRILDNPHLVVWDGEKEQVLSFQCNHPA